jgi:hypothetical protein
VPQPRDGPERRVAPRDRGARPAPSAVRKTVARAPAQDVELRIADLFGD